MFLVELLDNVGDNFFRFHRRPFIIVGMWGADDVLGCRGTVVWLWAGEGQVRQHLHFCLRLKIRVARQDAVLGSRDRIIFRFRLRFSFRFRFRFRFRLRLRLRLLPLLVQGAGDVLARRACARDHKANEMKAGVGEAGVDVFQIHDYDIYSSAITIGLGFRRQPHFADVFKL